MNAADTGRRIAQLRRQKGLTQKELGEKLNVSHGAVSKWERGLNYPDIELLEPLADLLGTTVLALMGLEHAAAESAVKEIAAISAAEKERIKRGIRVRAIYTIICMLIVAGAEIYASWLGAQAGLLGGRFGACTTGMLGFIGLTLGGAWYSLTQAKKL